MKEVGSDFIRDMGPSYAFHGWDDDLLDDMCRRIDAHDLPGSVGTVPGPLRADTANAAHGPVETAVSE